MLLTNAYNFCLKYLSTSEDWVGSNYHNDSEFQHFGMYGTVVYSDDTKACGYRAILFKRKNTIRKFL